jgi:hypothetical protein
MRLRRSWRSLALPLAVLAALVVPAVAPAPAAARAGAAGRPWTLAGVPCRLVPTAAPVGVGETCPGVRPGARVITPLGACTLNFMWKGSDGATYMGTAGHCLLEGTRVTEASFRPGAGPVARDGARQPIGRFAYAVLDGDSDFALVRLDPAAAATASPQVCHFGGPTGLAADALPPLAGLLQVGQGVATRTLLPARPELILEGADRAVALSLGLASAGDSGSPLLTTDRRAAGVVVATGPLLGPIGLTGLVLSTRLVPQLARAAAVTGVAYTLQTAPAL